LSSTYSSDETRRVPGKSPTEALAARYRHLFILPSKGPLIVLNAVAALALGTAAVGFSKAGIASVLAFAVALLSSFIITRAAKLSDRTSIATFRRSAAAVFAGGIIWFTITAMGLVYSYFQPTSHAAGNSVIFGGFLGAGFEFVVVNGAFVERTTTSAVLSAIHPLATAGAFFASGGISYDIQVIAPGAVAFMIAAAFPLILKQRKTSRGYNAVRLFQAFMKTWANDDASELEVIIDAHASMSKVSSKVLRFQQANGDIFIVLPGVHPGPFYPVGSYNLPGLLARSFEGLGRVLTLHAPGGHENNLATNAGAEKFAGDLRNFAETVRPTSEAKIQGPLVAKIGKSTVSTSAFGTDLLLTISFAPYGSDDLETGAAKELDVTAESQGYNALLVDAHNSIDEGREKLDLLDQGWASLIRGTAESTPKPLRIGYAHSSEVNLVAAGDLTTNGMALVLFEVDGTKWTLVLADANNAVPRLRQAVATALEAEGFRLLEFCTSDSHDLAARGLTVNRGYNALGEATSPESIVAATVRLAHLAESRLAGCRYGSGTLETEVNAFGSRALGEFAEITQRNSRFAKTYATIGGLSILVLLGVALLS
jgi:putative membrane protein